MPHGYAVYLANKGMVNWDVMHIGGDYSLANRVIFSVHALFIIHVIISIVLACIKFDN